MNETSETNENWRHDDVAEKSSRYASITVELLLVGRLSCSFVGCRLRIEILPVRQRLFGGRCGHNSTSRPLRTTRSAPSKHFAIFSKSPSPLRLRRTDLPGSS